MNLIPGNLLKNNAVVHLSKEDDGPGYIVLASWMQGGRIEYITWFVGPDGDCQSGHYYQDQASAIRDYLARS